MCSNSGGQEFIELRRTQDRSGRFHRFHLMKIFEQVDWHGAHSRDLICGLPHCALDLLIAE